MAKQQTRPPFIQETSLLSADLGFDRWRCRIESVRLADLTPEMGSLAVQIKKTGHSIPRLSNTKISALFDQGTIVNPEDQAVISPPFFGVFDGTSGVHFAGGPEVKSYTGKTGGAMASSVASEEFLSADPSDTLDSILTRANLKIASVHKHKSLDISQGGLLGGSVGVVAQILDESVRILQWGDSFAACKFKSGSAYMTDNQLTLHEAQMLATVTDLMQRLAKEYGTIDPAMLRPKMWQEFGPFLLECRNARINTATSWGYGFLCGQKNFLNNVVETFIPLDQLDTLILSTDGLVPFEETHNPYKLSKETFLKFENGGFDMVLGHQRRCELAKVSESHVTHTEATSIAIRF